jgi:hypothetical protein
VGEIGFEFQQATSGKNPWNEYATSVGGAGIEYVAFRMDDQLTPARRHLESLGGQMAVGNDSVEYSQYNLKSKLGMWLEVIGTPEIIVTSVGVALIHRRRWRATRLRKQLSWRAKPRSVFPYGLKGGMR